jgi:hypothetical protein
MKVVQKGIDFWIHDWLADKRQRAMADLVRFPKALWQHTRRT